MVPRIRTAHAGLIGADGVRCNPIPCQTSAFSIFSLAELRTTHQQLGLQTGNFMDFIDSLNNQGYLLKKGGRSYQLQTSDYS